ncbi:MAG TPA: ATP-dependent helicase HrpB [Xanthobacteraceae bacterium]|nr:ATP-dependent helicase HrpB [Xanthobacteraceae bacterium]
MDSPQERLHNVFPVDAVLPSLRDALRTRNAAVLVAQPGAGKTTRVPLALLHEPWAGSGKILVLEPRRIAARAAAQFMANSIGESLGDTVGLRVRFGSKVGRKTRIEMITEGVFTRLVLEDPELNGVCAVIFDEFHERSLDADLGLALALDAQRGLREDLRILVMSATLDGARIAKLLDGAPVIESEGRAFPVETNYLGRDARTPVPIAMADAMAQVAQNESGSILGFLPGVGEIRRTADLLSERIRDDAIDVVPLYGALDSSVQDKAIEPPAAGRRKIVLATSIAETSITIKGVRVVVDSGLARVPRFEPDLGLTRLETVRVSRASADQRRGRAGRTEPGICYRLWDEEQTRSLLPFATPEILAADLTGLVLDLAQWGVRDPATLTWLDPPPSAAISEARLLLTSLGALDESGAITALGKRLSKLPLHPRLAAMIVTASEDGEALLAAEIAAVVSERGLGGNDTDLSHRISEFRRDRSRRGEEARNLARRWAEQAGGKIHEADPKRAGVLLALAYPDRIARARTERGGAFLLANGRGAKLEAANALAREDYLAVAEIAGAAQAGRILLAARISEAELAAKFSAQIVETEEAVFDAKARAIRGRAVRKYHALVLRERPLKVEANEASARVLAAGIASIGIEALPLSSAAQRWRERVRFLRQAEGEDWPDLSNEALAETIESWIAPFVAGKTSLHEISSADVSNALHALLGHELARRLEGEAPDRFVAPTGSELAIDYAAEAGPTISVKVQELFGLSKHPSVAAGKIPLVLSLLSPAGRPIQVTRDLPAFWRGSWADVKKEMRGRYPKHVWPDDPASAAPTRRAKPRGT